MTLSVTLQHDFGTFRLDARFEAPPGLTVLFGRSGSGKTTIIQAVAGLLQPDAGRVTLDGQVLLDTDHRIALPPRRRRLGYIFQDARLFPHLTVRRNLFYGRWFAAARPDDGNDPAANPDPDRIIEMLGIGHLLDRRPGTLSGGEKQRVAIGRALLARPRLILADEPLAALDEQRKTEILPFFERLRDEVTVPVLYVSHAPTEVSRLATTVVALQDGQVMRQGSAAEVLGDPMVLPLGVRAAGAMLQATVAHHHADGLSELDASGVRLFLPRVPQPVGARIRVRIPAQDVILSRTRPEGLSALNIMAGTVQQVRPGDGPGAIVTLDTAAGRILARITRRSASDLGLEPGTACHAVIKTVAIAPEDVSG